MFCPIAVFCEKKSQKIGLSLLRRREKHGLFASEIGSIRDSWRVKTVLITNEGRLGGMSGDATGSIAVRSDETVLVLGLIIDIGGDAALPA
jgi:hypothetical protein